VAVSAGYALRASPTVIHITSLAGRLNAGVARILTGYAGRMPAHPGGRGRLRFHIWTAIQGQSLDA